MSAPPISRQSAGYQQPMIPPLESGDRLTSEEFQRRYEAMPELTKAELIEGVVYVSSPVRFDCHGEQHAELITWSGVYRLYTPGVRAGGNSTVRLDLGNVPQPDAVMIVDPGLGGRARIDRDGYLVAGPEWVGE